MGSAQTHQGSGPTAQACAEAAAWIARLHGPQRSPEVESGLRRWLAESSEHAAAFDHLTQIWDKAPHLRRRPLEQVANWRHSNIRVRIPRVAFGLAALVGCALIAVLFYYLHIGIDSRNDIVATDVGEQRILTLGDGTTIHLNTASRIRIHLDRRLRRIDLEQGEAFFEVARRWDWPFDVIAGTRKIEALGTRFQVRNDEQQLAVTLFDGKVAVSADTPDEHSNTQPQAVTRPQSAAALGRPATARMNAVFTLSPGERLTFAGNRAPVLDRPALDSLSAWQHGQVAFDDTPLADAAAEMNRYTHVQVVLGGPAIGALRMSGIFKTTDPAKFAAAVAQAYGLEVRDEGSRIVLVSRDAGASDGPDSDTQSRAR